MNNQVNLIVRLLDQVSAPLRGITRAFGQLSLAGAAAGAAMTAAVASAGALEARLTDIAITAGASGTAAREMVAGLRGDFQRLALDVGQSSAAVADAAQVLIAGGIDLPIVQRLLPAVGKAATAAGAAMDDMAATGLALADNLKVAPEEMERVFAALAVAGKAGRFELDAMAREFPSLTAAAAGLGLRGAEGAHTLGAALQVAMKGAANPTEAANNLKNFLSKVMAPETLKNFKALGVDLQAVMNDAAAKGINPFEAVIAKIRKLAGDGTDADKMARLGELFGDMQVLDFLKPALSNLDFYKNLKKEMAGAQVDILDTDAATRMATIEARMGRIKELGGQLIDRLGTAAAPALDPLIAGLDWLHAAVAELDRMWPGAIEGALAILAPLTAVVAIAAAGSMALGPLLSGLAGLGSVLGIALGPALPLIAAFAFLAWAITEHWDDLAPWFHALWGSITRIIGSALAVVRALWAGDGLGLRAAWAELMDDLAIGGEALDGLLAGLGGAIAATWTRLWDGLRDGVVRMGMALLVAIGVPMPRVLRIVRALGETFDIVGRHIAAWVGTTFGLLVAFGRGLLALWRGDLDGVLAAGREMWGRLVGLVDAALGAIIDMVDAWTGGALTDAIIAAAALWDDLRAGAAAALDGIGAGMDAAAGWVIAAWDRVAGRVEAVLALVRGGMDAVANSWLGRQLGLDDASQAAAALTANTPEEREGAEAAMHAYRALAAPGAAPAPLAPGALPAPLAPGAPPAPTAPVARAEVKTDIRVRVEAEQGSRVRGVEGSNPAIPLDTGALWGTA